MTRVLHLVAVPWEPTDGVARACQELVRHLDGCEHVLVADRDPGFARDAFAAVRVVPGWTPQMPWRGAFRRAFEVLAPDVVHVHGGELAPLLAYAPVFAGTAIVASCYAATPTVAGLDRAQRREHRANVSVTRAWATRLGGRALARHAVATGRVGVVCTSDPVVERVFASSGTVLHVTGGARPAPAAAQWSDDPTVVFAGRAQSGRGVDDLIDAFPILRARIPRARLRLLLLPGESADRWRARLAGAAWAEVSVGQVADLQAVYLGAQVAAFPFRWPVTMTPALAAAEAMAAGLPLVATSVPCLAPLVDPGVNGALVAPGDSVALAGALTAVLAGPDVWQPLAEGARKTIEQRWSWSEAADATADAYKLAQRRAS